MRRTAVLALVLGAAAALLRRRSQRGDGREVWTQATSIPDLR